MCVQSLQQVSGRHFRGKNMIRWRKRLHIAPRLKKSFRSFSHFRAPSCTILAPGTVLYKSMKPRYIGLAQNNQSCTYTWSVVYIISMKGWGYWLTLAYSLLLFTWSIIMKTYINDKGLKLNRVNQSDTKATVNPPIPLQDSGINPLT